MKLTENRFDPSLLTAGDRALVDQISELVFADERPALVGREGVRIDLPDPVFHMLVRVVRALREGQSVVMLPESECFTTQASANFLGVSRPFLIGLLETGEIPHHKTGTHRRVYLKDLLAYLKHRDAERRKALDALNDQIVEAGLYDKLPPVEDAR